ncbi:mas-related G-protein coupled receptor member A1-like [Sylvia borin]
MLLREEQAQKAPPLCLPLSPPHSPPQPLELPAAARLHLSAFPGWFPSCLHQQHHQTLHLLLGAAEEPHGPSRDSPGTDSPSTLTTARGHIPLPAQRPSMEVSTMSPPFISPTDGPDLCGISVSSLALHVVTLLVCLCGLAGNAAVVWLLHINAFTDFIFNQAITDFLFLIFMVPSTLLFLLEEVSCSAIMPLMYLSLLFQMSLFSYNMGLYRLTFISIERCRSILCLFFCGWQLSERLLWVVMHAFFWAFLFVVIAVNPTVTSLCQSHEQEHCRVALLSMYALSLFLFTVPMVISSTVLFTQLKPSSQQQQLKRLDIVVFLTALFNLPLSLWYLLQQLGYTVVSSQVVFLLNCINSSIKPFIYFLVGSWKRDYSMGRCWRHCSIESCRRHSSMQSLRKALQRVFEEPQENTACSDGATMDTGV